VKETGMSPFLSTLLSTLFLLCGAVAVYTMMAVQGGSVSRPRLYVKAHKTAGWLFAVLFVVMFVYMLQRVGEYWENFSALVAVHITLAVMTLLLLVFKVTTPRFFPRLNKNLYLLGIGVCLVSFTMVAVSAGHYVIHAVKGEPYLSHARLPAHMLDERLGKELFIEKCSTCHMLEQIMRPRSVEAWEKVVNQMVSLANPRITLDEAGQILHYLTLTHVPQTKEIPVQATLTQKHCLPCHEPDELFTKRFNRTGWTEILNKMHEYDPDIVPLDKTEEIVDFLLKKQGE
jgi:hypothetical protein